MTNLQIMKYAKSQSVLVHNISIESAEKIVALLAKEKEKGAHIRIRTFITDTGAERRELAMQMEVGDILVTTALGSRGMDARLSRLVLGAGGLVVIILDPPPHLRLELQEFGRAGRKGESGMGFMILLLSDIEALIGKSLSGLSDQEVIKQWPTERERNVKSQLDTFEAKQLPQIRLRGNFIVLFK